MPTLMLMSRQIRGESRQLNDIPPITHRGQNRGVEWFRRIPRLHLPLLGGSSPIIKSPCNRSRFQIRIRQVENQDLLTNFTHSLNLLEVISLLSSLKTHVATIILSQRVPSR